MQDTRQNQGGLKLVKIQTTGVDTLLLWMTIFVCRVDAAPPPQSDAKTALPSSSILEALPFAPSHPLSWQGGYLMPMQQLDTFVFWLRVRMEEKEASSIIEFVNKQLAQIGNLTQKEISTEGPVDLECFSYPALTFILEQLIDPTQQPLPVLRANLVLEGLGEICKTKKISPLNIENFSMYINRDKATVRSAIEQTLPSLLQRFLEVFQEANGKEKKPNFFIVYTPSDWAPLPLRQKVRAPVIGDSKNK